MRNEIERKGRNDRVVDRRCGYCGNDKMWSSRSQTGRGLYAYKCTKCGHVEK